MASGTRWIERLMPPVVTGSVVAVIGLNLAVDPDQEHGAERVRRLDGGRDLRQRSALVAVFTRGMVRRLLILVGLVVATIVYAVLTNGLGLGKPIDFTRHRQRRLARRAGLHRAGVRRPARCC